MIVSRSALSAPALPVALVLVLAGCEGRQSALAPAGREAAQLATLFWFMLAGAVVLWVLVNGLFLYVTRLNPRPLSRRLAESVIIGGGIVFPFVVLAALLGYGLSIMPMQREPGSGLTLHVTGEQWWWRVEYRLDGEPAARAVVAANEVRLPVGRRTEIRLDSAEVIHSFWIPALAGKTDMFPGRETRMALEPDRTGVFRGQCAEFCGTSHGLMAFEAVVMEADAFDAWLERERGEASPPADALSRRGQAVFLAEGCGACHAVRGTPASGGYGPDLTHVGGRESLGAGVLSPEPDSFARWIAHTDVVKPDVDMPSYGHLAEDDLEALASYLAGLE